MDYTYGIEIAGKESITPVASRAEKALARLRKEASKSITTTGGIVKANRLYSKELDNVIKKTTSENLGLKRTAGTQKEIEKVLSDSSDAYSKRIKQATNYGKIEDTQNKRVKKQIQNHKELNKNVQESSKIRKSYSEKLEASGRIYTKLQSDIQKTNIAKAEAIKISKNQIGATKRVGAANQYMDKLLNTSNATFQKWNKTQEAAAIREKAATEIRSKGIKAIDQGLRTQLKTRTKIINQIHEAGITGSAAFRQQSETIMKANTALKRHGISWGNLQKKMGRGLEFIHKAGMLFLTTLGPIFLVGAALRTLKQAAEWVYQPFIKFEDALYELRKTAGLTKTAMLDVGDAISELSLRIPIAADELANIAATAGRLGIRGRENIMKFTETIAKMSVATTLTANQAAKDLAKIREAFGLPIDAVEKLGSVLNELENTTASTVEELVEGMKNIGASGKLIGITVDEAAALAATLIEAGMEGSRAGTRIRRMLTEVARKAGEITEFMGKQGKKWREALETDPMQALMMYIKKLGEVESNIDKVAIAHSHFGKVAGFAISTLAENYDGLIENLERAREEIAFGTSLEEEFQIAIGKTSAQLQILENRSDAARRVIGEDLIPVLITSKEATVFLTEALSELIEGLTWQTRKIDESATGINIYYSELKRLREESEEATLGFDDLGVGILEVGKYMTSQGNTIFEAANAWKELSELMKEGNLNLADYGKTIIGFGVPALRMIMNIHDGVTKVNKEILDLNNYLAIQSRIVTTATIAWKYLYDELKNVSGETGKATEATKLWIDYQNKIPNMLENTEEIIEDNAKEKERIMIIEEALQRKAMKDINDVLELRAKEGTLVGDMANRYEDSQEYLASFSREEGKMIGLIGDSSAAYQLNNTLIKWRNEGIDKSSTMYMRLTGIFGDNTDEMIKNSQVIEGLNKEERMLIQNGEDILIVGQDLNKYFDGSTDVVKEATGVIDLYGNSLSQSAILIADLINIERGYEQVMKDSIEANHELATTRESLLDISDSYRDSIFQLYDVEGQLIDIRKKAEEQKKEGSKNAKKWIGVIDEEYETAQELIEIGEYSEGIAIKTAIAQDLVSEATKIRTKLEKKLSDSTRKKLEEDLKGIELAMKYIDALDKAKDGERGLIIEEEKRVDILKDLSIQYKGLEHLMEIAGENELTRARQATKVLQEVGIIPIDIEIDTATLETLPTEALKLSKMIGEAISKPELSEEDLATVVANINDYLKTEKPELDITVTSESIQKILEDVEEKSKDFPESEIDIAINEDYLSNSLKTYFEELGPYIIKIKTVGEGEPLSGQFGIPNVPYTGLYKLHKGEEVVSAHEVKNYNKHDINVRINFAGNVPSGMNNAEVKKIVHDEISKAVRATY